MQIKAQGKQPQNASSNFPRYNLCFAYSNSRKHSDSKGFQSYTRHFSTSLNKNPHTEPFPISRISQEFKTNYKEKSFFQTARRKESMLALEEGGPDDIQYITNPFPQRKKKSGQHQLIKLLIKYSINAAKQPNSSNNPLFSQQANKTSKGNWSKGKNLTRLNWVKDRYCANRDKEHRGINEQQSRFGFANRTHYDTSMLPSTLRPKRLF